MLGYADVEKAAQRIEGYVHETPLVDARLIGDALGHTVLLKAENRQKVGAFKARGALNTLLHHREIHDSLPGKVVAYSSGNHAQAVAWAANQLGVKAEIFMPKTVSEVKAQATRAYGAKVTLLQTRQQAEDAAAEAQAIGAYLLPPYDHDQVICGQGTAALEALKKNEGIDAIFAPVGGGGLLSGTILAAEPYSGVAVYGAEPVVADDAIRSIETGIIQRFETQPPTIADGIKTLGISERTFNILKHADGFFRIPEDEITYWTQWIGHTTKEMIEPTSGLGMAAAYHWLKGQGEPKKVLVILSGGNMDNKKSLELLAKDHLTNPPSRDLFPAQQVVIPNY